MAAIDDLRTWFERDLRFAAWEENVKVDASQPGITAVHFYTDTNEYILSISERPEDSPGFEAMVMARKPRAGQSFPRRRLLLPNQIRFNERTWKVFLGCIVGIELVRVQRREEAATEPQSKADAGASVPVEVRRAQVSR